MTTEESLIVVEDLIKVYEGRQDLALKGINLDVREGECFGLLGPNGAGKTTLMGCILGLLNPDGGRIKIAGLDPNDLAVREVIGFLPERPHFETWFTAFEFLSYHHALAGGSKKTRKQDVTAMLEKVELVHDAWNRKTNKFSRGMLQRLGLAQALIGNPKIVLLDEPGSGMDPPGVALLRTILLDLKKNKVTVVLNSHHLDEMERVCDRVAFIRNGQLSAIKSMSSESDYPHILKMRFTESENGLNLDEIFNQIAVETGASIVEFDRRSARVAVTSGRMAAAVIKTTVGKNLEVQSASPESTSLEHLFKEVPELFGDDEKKDERNNLSRDAQEDTQA